MALLFAILVSFAGHHISSTIAASIPMPTDYCSTVTYHTNLHRANHSAPLVTYNSSVAAMASQNIINCASHPAEIVGSNFAQYWGTGPDPHDQASATVMAIHDWYEAEQLIYANATKDYTTTPDFSTFDAWGHFSQMVWVTETQIGCWSVSCGKDTPFSKQFSPVPDWTWAVVCASVGPGNSGDYIGNVKPPLGNAPSDYSILSNNPC